MGEKPGRVRALERSKLAEIKIGSIHDRVPEIFSGCTVCQYQEGRHIRQIISHYDDAQSRHHGLCNGVIGEFV